LRPTPDALTFESVTRRPVALALAMVVALTAQVTWATPARAVRELRAVSCCATHCAHTKPASRAAHCCQRDQDGGTTAVVSAAPIAPSAPLVALSIAPAAVPAPCSAARLTLGHERSLGRAGPVFLFTRALLL
jgi:hypothetical protein